MKFLTVLVCFTFCFFNVKSEEVNSKKLDQIKEIAAKIAPHDTLAKSQNLDDLEKIKIIQNLLNAVRNQPGSSVVKSQKSVEETVDVAPLMKMLSAKIATSGEVAETPVKKQDFEDLAAKMSPQTVVRTRRASEVSDLEKTSLMNKIALKVDSVGQVSSVRENQQKTSQLLHSLGEKVAASKN
ncbi:uncharacterized protein LOC123011575 [Tribolium madens]|uniref:uncharacterized protein LOC123011575 n=1 Tax=Tribolium madens TaxID=41895 RepID=UPI001CF73FA8|nr:uncharacterized protein LOC123011575 [Tribolium madens]